MIESEVSRIVANVMIVESQDDEAFLRAIIEHINESNHLTITIVEFYILDGIERENYRSLEQRLKRLNNTLLKDDIQKIGIVLDLDEQTREERLALVSQCIQRVFREAVRIDDTQKLFQLNASTNTQIGCHFLHVNEQGELETVLREIKTQDSPHADCVEAWRFCLAQKNIDINRKKIDKLWIQNYIREDTPSQNEKREAKKYCNLSHALTKKDIWNFEHEVLNELKEFLQLFAV
jgi:hypothetical protein